MDKTVLVQHSGIKEEIKDIKKRIGKLEADIAKIVQEGEVTDTARGGSGGMQHFKVAGFPVPECSHKLSLLRQGQRALAEKEEELLLTMNLAEEYIETIQESELRLMFRYYYIDNLTWAQVAVRMNAHFPKRRIAYTEESCRKKHSRFLEKK